MSGKSKSSRKNEKSTSNLNKIIFASVIGTVLFFAVICLLSLIALKSNGFNSSLYMPAVLLSGALSGFMGGFTAVRPVRKNGAAYGALTGLVQAVVCSAAAFFINGNKAGSTLFILIAVIIAMGAAGGISAVNLKVRKKY